MISAREFFTRRLGRSTDPRFARVRASYRFDIAGAGSWRLTIENGKFNFEESREPVDCVLRFDEKDFTEIINGQRNAFTTFLQGRAEAEGDRAQLAAIIPFLRRAA